MAKAKQEKNVDLEHVDPATLVPWEKNPRRNDDAVSAVARSIERFSFGSPVVARPSDRRVLAGHTRLKAALLLGLRTVPVRWLELSGAEADAFALADNRLGGLAEWDDAGLAGVLRDLTEVDASAVEAAGFSDLDMARLEGETLESQLWGTAKLGAGPRERPRHVTLVLSIADAERVEALFEQLGGEGESRAEVLVRALEALAGSEGVES